MKRALLQNDADRNRTVLPGPGFPDDARREFVVELKERGWL